MIAQISKKQLSIKSNSQLIQGTVGEKMNVEFSDDWSALSKTAVFAAEDVTRDVIISADEITIPWELLTKAGQEAVWKSLSSTDTVWCPHRPQGLFLSFCSSLSAPMEPMHVPAQFIHNSLFSKIVFLQAGTKSKTRISGILLNRGSLSVFPRPRESTITLLPSFEL